MSARPGLAPLERPSNGVFLLERHMHEPFGVVEDLFRGFPPGVTTARPRKNVHLRVAAVEGLEVDGEIEVERGGLDGLPHRGGSGFDNHDVHLAESIESRLSHLAERVIEAPARYLRTVVCQ